jgi:adenosylhomocysteine nucleosidase
LQSKRIIQKMNDQNQYCKVILISADQEWDAVKTILLPTHVSHSPFGEWFIHPVGGEQVIFFLGGWGKVAAAATTQYVIDRWHPALLINLGTCGGFESLVKKGDILLVNETLVYDMVEQMGDPDAAVNFYRTKIDLSWLPTPYPQKVILSRLVSGDRDLVPSDIALLKERYEAIAGDWESASIAWVAGKNGVRCLILRGVSDIVHPLGSEAYGNIEAFVQGARAIMQQLLEHLAQWIQ